MLDFGMNAVSLAGSALNALWLIPLWWLCLRRFAAGAGSAIQPSTKARMLRLVAGFGLALVLVALLKYGLQWPRPGIVFGSEVVHSWVGEDSRYSFPSGHAMFAMWLAVNLWPRAASPLRAVLVVYVLAVGLARINLGMHFPIDVVVGYAVGGLCAWASLHASQRLPKQRPQRIRANRPQPSNQPRQAQTAKLPKT